MTETTSQPIPAQSKRGLFQQLELDMRLLGMIGAFVILCIGFNILTDGRFLTPRNIFNLTIQTVSVAIMATGMVFVIVTRNIDLSVGALLATCSAVCCRVTYTMPAPLCCSTCCASWLFFSALATTCAFSFLNNFFSFLYKIFFYN